MIALVCAPLLFDSVQFPICIYKSVTDALDNKVQVTNFLSMAYVRGRQMPDGENDTKGVQALQLPHSGSCVGRVETYVYERQKEQFLNNVRCSTLDKFRSHSRLGRVEK